MAPSLIRSPVQLPPAEALTLSQQAPAILQSSPSTVSSSALSSLFSAAEKPELWIQYENLILSCLRTGDDRAAQECLNRLVARFGNNDRVMALGGLIKEAQAQNNGELETILKEYDQMLEQNNANLPIMKRRIALLRSMGRLSDAGSALVQLLDFSPTDSEAWSELSDLYFSQGLYPQAIYAMEEVLILAPNAWNVRNATVKQSKPYANGSSQVHARLGELQYMAATASGVINGSYQKQMAEAIKRFSRSIELCDDYLRGYYGLKLVTKRLLKDNTKPAGKVDDEDFTLPDSSTIERLNELATAKLAEIVRHSSAQDRGWKGYDAAEVAAARELLSEDAPSGIER
ncbi:hypothetical protein QBC40DRAFT_167224 [Triangularia verruculosa]|uniref:ER membrane protein complex subunit 2 n=1 Tax=Triangularia verruculosa TaxID=2587418 RepID=A0AAN7AY60_9PEZI|nr:hypothetical protein QBC40DRAFT_167224 [Triangularia verruculosa]